MQIFSQLFTTASIEDTFVSRVFIVSVRVPMFFSILLSFHSLHIFKDLSSPVWLGSVAQFIEGRGWAAWRENTGTSLVPVVESVDGTAWKGIG